MRAAGVLHVNSSVLYTLVRFGARSGELLIPTVPPYLLDPGIETSTADPPQTADSPSTMFTQVDFQPVAVPLLEDDRDDERGDLVRPVRRLRVRANRKLYANANTMVRPRGQADNER